MLRQSPPTTRTSILHQRIPAYGKAFLILSNTMSDAISQNLQSCLTTQTSNRTDALLNFIGDIRNSLVGSLSLDLMYLILSLRGTLALSFFSSLLSMSEKPVPFASGRCFYRCCFSHLLLKTPSLLHGIGAFAAAMERSLMGIIAFIFEALRVRSLCVLMVHMGWLMNGRNFCI
jgi:hypothetical protein